MLDAIEKNCHEQLKTLGKYRMFCTALLTMLGASQEVVTDDVLSRTKHCPSSSSPIAYCPTGGPLSPIV
eukprot:6335569-Karenia_brevis.AAC.1